MWIFSSPACPIHTFSTVERLQLRCAGVQLKINIVTLSRIVTRARKLQLKLFIGVNEPTYWSFIGGK